MTDQPDPETWRTDPRERLLAAIDSTWAYGELGATPEQLVDDYAHHLAAQDADQTDPPEFAGGQHWWIHARTPDGGSICGPGSSDRDAAVTRLAELRAAHPDTVYRLVCETTHSAVEDA